MTGAPRIERVQLNGADIEYDVRGSGEPVVFIHGAILSDGFVPVIEGMPGHVRRHNAQVIQQRDAVTSPPLHRHARRSA